MVEWPGSSRNMPAKRWTAQLVQREIWSVLSYPSALRFSIFADPACSSGSASEKRGPRESLESKNKKTRWTCKQGAEARGQEQVGGSPLFFFVFAWSFLFFLPRCFLFLYLSTAHPSVRCGSHFHCISAVPCVARAKYRLGVWEFVRADQPSIGPQNLMA